MTIASLLVSIQSSDTQNTTDLLPVHPGRPRTRAVEVRLPRHVQKAENDGQ
jgi:hypothetical protein